MFGRSAKWSLVLAIALLTIVAPLVAANEPTGSWPGDALTPSGEWATLDVGQTVWYAFYLPGADKDGDAPEAKIKLQVVPRSAATFELWTPQRLHELQIKDEGEFVEAVGAGSAEDTSGAVGKVNWAGELSLPGIYYVAVSQTGPLPASYKLSITGDKVAFQQAGASAAARTIAPAPAAKPGGGPSDALTPTGEWTPLGVGEGHWYAFTVPGWDKDGNAPLTHVELLATPLNSARFCVWTPGGLRVWQTGAEDERTLPVGRGTPEDPPAGSNTDKVTWTGSFVKPGTYYVCVNQTGTEPTSYKLNITTE